MVEVTILQMFVPALWVCWLILLKTMNREHRFICDYNQWILDGCWTNKKNVPIGSMAVIAELRGPLRDASADYEHFLSLYAPLHQTNLFSWPRVELWPPGWKHPEHWTMWDNGDDIVPPVWNTKQVTLFQNDPFESCWLWVKRGKAMLVKSMRPNTISYTQFTALYDNRLCIML